jgi:hypothetical protein
VKDHYCVLMFQPLDPVLRHTNQVHTHSVFKIYSDNITVLLPTSYKWFLSHRMFCQKLCVHFACVTCQANLAVFGTIILIIFDEQSRFISSLSSNLFHHSVPSFLLLQIASQAFNCHIQSSLFALGKRDHVSSQKSG